MLNLDCHILGQVVSKALADAADHPRWINAIQRAFEELDSNPYIARGELHGLVIGSPSGNVYSANGVCQCQAYLNGHACWHRAAARLVRLHDETQQHRELAAAARARQADEQEANPAALRDLSTQVDTAPAQMGQRLAAARAATARLNDLFA